MADIRESECPQGSLLEAALQVLPHPVVVYDRSGIIFANRATLQLAGVVDLSEMLGDRSARFVHSDSTDGIQARLDLVLDGRRSLSKVPFKAQTANGPLHIQLEIRPVAFDGRTAALALVSSRDGTEPERQTQASGAPGGTSRDIDPTAGGDRAHPAGSLCEAALDALPLGVVIYDDVLLFANQSARRALGIKSLQDVAGTDMGVFAHPDAVDAEWARKRLVVEREQSLTQVPIKLLSRDGVPFRLVVDYYPVRFEGQTYGMAVAEAGSAVYLAERPVVGIECGDQPSGVMTETPPR